MALNNTWLKITDSPTAVVFVHGILSDSDCWRNKKFDTYWPNMVAEDQAFGNVSVFLSGYTASLGAGLYDTFDAAEEVMVYLRTSKPSVLSKSNLLFVCHSQGGIVVRQMLCSKWQDFEQKNVGVVLCGSPSWGSVWASILTPVTLLIKFRQGSALKWGGASLVTLDRQFLALIDGKRIGDLSGMSLVETKGPLVFPPIVSEASATRYFPTWKRIPNARHGDIIRPRSPQALSHKYLTDFARSKGFIDDQSSLSAAGAVHKKRLVSVPQTDFADQVEHEFVGRAEMRDELSDLIARLKERRGTVYWAHGFGGMGKSFLLRRAFLDVPPNVKKALVDWDDQTNRFRKPLRNTPTSVADLFDPIAYACHAVFGSEKFERYWSASDVVRESESKRAGFERTFDTRVEQLVRVLSQQNPEDFPQASISLPDHLETADDANRQVECECLLALVSDEPKVKKVLVRLRRVQRNREEFFDHVAWETLVGRWINGIAPTEEEHVRDPGGYLSRELYEVTTEHLEHQEFVLLLDTLEVLSPRLDRHLCQFLATITNSGFPLLTIIASRFEPDSRLPGGSFSGWHDLLGGRLKTEAFGRNARFTPTDVRQLLSRLRRPIPNDVDLPEKIIARTLGLPMAVSAMFRMHEDGDEDLSTFDDWDVIDPLLDESAAMQKVIDQTASRILLHLDIRQRDEDALRDVIFLTVGEGAWLARLQELWWGDRAKRRDRLFQLTRQIDFMDGGSIQPEARQYLVKSWSSRPHALLPSVVDQAVTLICAHRDDVLLDLSSLCGWLRTYASFVLWVDSSLALEARIQAAVLQLANSNLPEYEDGSSGQDPRSVAKQLGASRELQIGWEQLTQLERSPYLFAVSRNKNVLDFLESMKVGEWPTLAQASWHYVLGMAFDPEEDYETDAKRKEATKAALYHLKNAIHCFQDKLPERQSVLQRYLEVITSLTINQDEEVTAREGIEWLLREHLLDDPEAGGVWLNYGKLLHNVKQYDESNSAYEKAMTLDPDLWFGRAFIAHNYMHQAKRGEEITTLEALVEEHHGTTGIWTALANAYVDTQTPREKIIKLCRRAVHSARNDPDLLVNCGKLLLIACDAKAKSAKVILEVALPRLIDGSDEKHEAIFWLIVADEKLGNLDTMRERSHELLRLESRASQLNHFGWQAFLRGVALDFGLTCSERSLEKQPSDHSLLNTRFALLCRMQRWDKVPDALAEWLNNAPVDEVRDAWSEHVHIFRYVQSVGRGSWMADQLRRFAARPELVPLATVLELKGDLANPWRVTART